MRRLLTVWLLLHLVSVPHALARPAITGHVVTTVGDVGAHYPLFRLEKSHHPANLTIVYTKLDPHCRVLPDPVHGGQPTLDFYWLMDATRYKPMAARLKAGIRQRLQVTAIQGPPEAPTALAVRLDALARLTHALRRPTVQITTARQGAACVATASLTLGPACPWRDDPEAGGHCHHDRSPHAAQATAGDGGSRRSPGVCRDGEGDRPRDGPADRAHLPRRRVSGRGLLKQAGRGQRVSERGEEEPP